jgi:hypothetical protein
VKELLLSDPEVADEEEDIVNQISALLSQQKVNRAPAETCALRPVP